MNRPLAFAAAGLIGGVLAGAFAINGLISAAPSAGRINLPTNITRPAVNEGGICPAQALLDWEAQVVTITYKTCDNANPPNYTGHPVYVRFDTTGSLIEKPFGAAPVRGAVTWTQAEADLAPVPGVLKTLTRRATGGS